MKEIRILLTESTFTNVCKMGYITHRTNEHGSFDINISKLDLKKIASGSILEKLVGDDILLKIAIQDIGSELIKEIIRRSPVYSDLYYEI